MRDMNKLKNQFEAHYGTGMGKTSSSTINTAVDTIVEVMNTLCTVRDQLIEHKPYTRDTSRISYTVRKAYEFCEARVVDMVQQGTDTVQATKDLEAIKAAKRLDEDTIAAQKQHLLDFGESYLELSMRCESLEVELADVTTEYNKLVDESDAAELKHSKKYLELLTKHTEDSVFSKQAVVNATQVAFKTKESEARLLNNFAAALSELNDRNLKFTELSKDYYNLECKYASLVRQLQSGKESK